MKDAAGRRAVVVATLGATQTLASGSTYYLPAIFADPIAAVLLACFGPVAAVPFVLLHGGGNGMLTIARGTLPLALFSSAGYGLRTGTLAAPARILQGGAPLFGLVLDRGGPLHALLLSGTVTGRFLALLLLRAPAKDGAAQIP